VGHDDPDRMATGRHGHGVKLADDARSTTVGLADRDDARTCSSKTGQPQHQI